MLKRKLAGLVVAGLLSGAGAVNAAESAIAGNADEGSTVLPSLSTYADQLRGTAGAGAANAAESAIAGNADEGSTVLPSLSTYAARYRGVQRAGAESAFPSSNATD